MMDYWELFNLSRRTYLILPRLGSCTVRISDLSAMWIRKARTVEKTKAKMKARKI